jgi:acetyl esterase
MNANLEVHDVPISGHEQHIMLRSYRPTFEKRILPIILYFHGGGFTNGDLEEADLVASQVAERIPAWVVSVGYSLAPEFPFPTAPEDAHIALTWAVRNARHYRGRRRSGWGG